MRDLPSPATTVADVVTFLLREAARYVCFFVNIPLVLSLVAWVVAFLVTLENVYTVGFLKWLGRYLPNHVDIHLDGDEMLRIYAIATLVVFVVWDLIRLVFKIERPAFGRFVLNGVVALTTGWAVVIAHVPSMTLSRGQTRSGVVVMCIAVYAVGVISFLAGALIMELTDALTARFSRNRYAPSPDRRARA